MLRPSYSILCEPKRHLVRITMSGFFSTADVETFTAAREQHYANLRCPPNQHLTLCDASGMKIQTQEVVAAFTKAVHTPRYASRRLALVVGSSLARIQTQRVSEEAPGVQAPRVRLFRCMDEAETWLFSD